MIKKEILSNATRSVLGRGDVVFIKLKDSRLETYEVEEEYY
jgi:hypothetical protein